MTPAFFVARGRTIQIADRPLVMGIVNLSLDSFSGDGLANTETAIEHARTMIAHGADIIDIGAESARTNRAAIGIDEETFKLREFVAAWSARSLRTPKGELVILSINTWRPDVARGVLSLGGDLLNDIGALPTDENARVCAETGAALLIMHSVGEPKIPHTHVGYADIMERLDAFFEDKIRVAVIAGLPREAILLDPGIDFAKQRADNLRIYHELARLHRFERPILLPVSRKTVIGDVLGIADPAERDAGTVACIVQGMAQGAHIFRVHNVRAASQTVRMIAAISEGPAR